MKHATTALLLILTTVAAAIVVVPVYEEPFHRLVADSREFKILDIRIPPGETTLYHTHAEPTFYITLQRTSVRAQMPGQEWGRPSIIEWQAGDVRHDDNARTNPFTHRVNNTGDKDFRLTLITNDRLEIYVSDLDLMQSMPGEHGVDSKYFAQSTITLGPGEALDWDGVDHVLIFVLVTDTHVVVRGKTEKSFAWGMLQSGDAQSINSDDGFQFHNRSDRPATIIAVAVR